jgi:hypothetical protein
LYREFKSHRPDHFLLALAQWLLPYKDRTGSIAPYANMTNEVLWVAKQAKVD